MKTVALYGVATKDRIVVLNSDYHSGPHQPFLVKDRMGGIFNVQRALHSYYPELPVSLVFDHITNSTINVWKNKKQSFTEWKFDGHLNPVKADWHHILYLDQLRNFAYKEVLFKFKGILSVDLCDREFNQSDIDEIMPYIDYLFIADDHPNFKDRQYIGTRIRRAVIAHTAFGVEIIKDKLIECCMQAKHIDYLLDTLGAGDYFAAGFIAARIDDKSLLDSVQTGHQVAAKQLENQRV